ncbi:hypothetical protein SDC9_56942 [bioreactor metagenome]|uniref:ParB/Spo0J HTH domain-containing protein n=1 Tax=bioreactor metagenome TaxID=1076179 RepID=A0A644X378_9ZZZZ
MVPVIIQETLEDEDEKLRKLLAANFGRLKNDENKQRKVAVEYVKLCGLKNGERSELVDNRLPLREIASQLGTSETGLKELLLIERKLTPEIKDILDSGLFTKTTASKVLTKLSEEEQRQLISMLPAAQKLTQEAGIDGHPSNT